MIQISKNELLKSTLLPNKILIKPDNSQQSIKLSNINLEIDRRFGLEKHAFVTGIILNQCNQLNHEAADWETEIETQINDHVIYSFESANDAEEKHYIDEDNNKYYILDYQDLFCAIRNNELIGLNGFLLCEPLEDEEVVCHSELLRTETIEQQHSSTRAKIKILSKPNKNYFWYGKQRDDRYDPLDEMSVNDTIIFSVLSDLPIEFSAHQSQPKLFRIQRHDILAIC